MSRPQPDPDDVSGSPSHDSSRSDYEPTWADLDREDLAELAAGRTSRDKDHAALSFDKSQPPPSAALRAQSMWWFAAGLAGVVLLYGIVQFGAISDAVRGRLAEGNRADPKNAVAPEQIDGLSYWMPLLMLVTLALVVVIQTALMRGIIRRRSRHCRNMFLSFCVVTLLGTVVGVDLLLQYDSIPAWIRWVSWVQFAAVVVSMVLVLSRSVGAWLPPSSWLPHRTFTARR